MVDVSQRGELGRVTAPKGIPGVHVAPLQDHDAVDAVLAGGHDIIVLRLQAETLVGGQSLSTPRIDPQPSAVPGGSRFDGVRESRRKTYTSPR